MNYDKGKTYEFDVEYTDTFGGEPNYSWVRRERLVIPFGTSDREVMRRMKNAMGLTNVKGRTFHNGDYSEFRPYRSCTILTGQVVY